MERIYFRGGEEHKAFNVQTIELVDIKQLMLRLDFPVVIKDYGAGVHIKALGCRR